MLDGQPWCRRNPQTSRPAPPTNFFSAAAAPSGLRRANFMWEHRAGIAAAEFALRGIENVIALNRPDAGP